MKVVSLFSGAGGLDKGFEEAGMDIIWANEFDKKIHSTYRFNFQDTQLDTRSIIDIDTKDIPKCDGIIGGPPCQSWSIAGALRGIDDERGQLFVRYLEIIDAKRPKFFLAENVPGMLIKRNLKASDMIHSRFEKLGYHVRVLRINAENYGVPQSRKRIFYIGYLKDYGKQFLTPEKDNSKPVLKDMIWDLRNNAVASLDKNKTNPKTKFANHEYMTGDFSSMYMSRNRVRSWDEPSFTIQAGGRHAPCHPQAPRMEFLAKDEYRFAKGSEHLYRRLTVRECARIQTFPDNYSFKYENLLDGYKMIGNAVPIKLAYHIANKIYNDLSGARRNKKNLKKKASVYQIKEGAEKQVDLQFR